MATSNLNVSPTNTKNPLFDLNTIPANSDDHYSGVGDFRDEGDSLHTSAETTIDSGEPVVRIISYSDSTIVIDFNVTPAEESNAQILELDVNQLYEESEDHFVGDHGKIAILFFLLYCFFFCDPFNIISL